MSTDDVHQPGGVHQPAPADIPALAAMLARAFDDDPVSIYLFGGEANRRRGLYLFFTAQLRGVFLPAGRVYAWEGNRSAALWMPPGRTPASPVQLLRLLPALFHVRERLPAAIRLLTAIERHHPKPQHFYLGVLGTDPPHQGHGLGSAVMAPVLEECDRLGMPAYLESSKERNVPFYRRHGFEVTEELRLPGAPCLWLMWREPRPPG